MPRRAAHIQLLSVGSEEKVGDERIRLTVDQRRWRSIVASEESYGYIRVANLWTEFLAHNRQRMVKKGNGCKTLEFPWWLQL